MAVFDGGEIVEKLLAEECDTKLLDGLLARWPAIDRAIIASTGGRTAPLARMLRVRAVKCLEFTPATPVPIRNGYDTPETLGADRLAAAVGGRRSWPKGATRWSSISERPSPSTTCRATAPTAAGPFRPEWGCVFRRCTAIRPGFRCAARLPKSAFTGRLRPPASSRGVMNGIAFEIEGYIARFRRENADICIIFTGGAAKNFAKKN